MPSTRRVRNSGASASSRRRSTSTNTGWSRSRSKSDSGVENSTNLPACQARRDAGLAAAEMGGEQQQAALAGSLGEERGDGGIHVVALDLEVAVGTVDAAGAGEEEAEVVVDFGGGGDAGAGIAAGGFLADGDGGRDALDGIHLGLFHALEELAGVGGEGLDVAALAF